MSNVILQASGVHKTYQLGRTSLKVLRGCSISVASGEFVCIMGSSGSGKSTLLHILGGLDQPGTGTVIFEKSDLFAGCTRPPRLPWWGHLIPIMRWKQTARIIRYSRSIRRLDRQRNRDFGFVFQFYHLLPELTVLENVLIPCMVGNSTLSWFGKKAEVRRYAAELLDRMGLSERLRHRPNELSGGERQRVAIARALANKPKVLLADEPTGNLDTTTGREILGVLKTLNEQGQTIVMVTHDPQVAAAAHRIVTLVDGKIVQTDSPRRHGDTEKQKVS